MMEDQKKHEMQWYSERQALKQALANRADSAAQAHSILQSLTRGGNESSALSDSADDAEAELSVFDQKTYAAQRELQVSMTAELKGLGVPFFGTDASLVVADESNSSLRSAREGLPKWSAIVTETQLLELRRRMVGHLEDLYRD